MPNSREPGRGITLWQLVAVAVITLMLSFAIQAMQSKKEIAEEKAQDKLLQEVVTAQHQNSTLIRKIQQTENLIRREFKEHRIRNEQVHFVLQCILQVPIAERTDPYVTRCENAAVDVKVPRHPPDGGKRTVHGSGGDEDEGTASKRKVNGRAEEPAPKPSPEPRPEPSPKPSPKPTEEPPLICVTDICIETPL